MTWVFDAGASATGAWNMTMRNAGVPAQTISAERAASLVKSGMWLDYGTSLCQPDVFDKALAAGSVNSPM